MRVLQVIPTLANRYGGPVASVVGSCLALERCGVRTTIFATDAPGPPSVRFRGRLTSGELPAGAAGLDVRLFPVRALHRLCFAPSLYGALARELPAVDVVHIHSLFLFPQFAASRQAQKHRAPYVLSPRGALDPYLRRRGRLRKAVNDALWQRRALERAAALHVTSDDEAALIADIAPRVRRIVVPNGIRWAEFQDLGPRERFRARHLGGYDGPLVVNVGRLSHKKALDVLIRAFARVSRELDECRLVFVGPDDEGLTPRLQRVAASDGVDGRVTFTGMLVGDEKLSALAAADVWALPSHTENFGVAVVEALAAGLPVVISPAVNIARDVAEAGAGVVCESDPAPLAAELAALLRDRTRREELGERAREFARRYDWDSVAPRLAAMYRAVAEPAQGDALCST